MVFRSSARSPLGRPSGSHESVSIALAMLERERSTYALRHVTTDHPLAAPASPGARASPAAGRVALGLDAQANARATPIDPTTILGMYRAYRGRQTRIAIGLPSME